MCLSDKIADADKKCEVYVVDNWSVSEMVVKILVYNDTPNSLRFGEQTNVELYEILYLSYKINQYYIKYRLQAKPKSMKNFNSNS